MVSFINTVSSCTARGLAVIGVFVASVVTVPSTRVVADSPDYEVINYNSVMCLDVAHASTADGAAVHQWGCHGGTNQQWRMVPDWYSDGYFLMVAEHSDKCLDVAHASTADGAIVHQWTCHNGANQQWSVASAGGGFPVPGNHRYQIKNRHSGKCLEVVGASTRQGATVRQGACNGGLHQLWFVVLP